MARLPRLAFADHAHLVLLRGHSGQHVFADDRDRDDLLSGITDSCRQERVALHAYALTPERVWLLCTPRSPLGLGRAMQAIGRRYTAVFNRRHGRRGTLWDGRYRAAAVEAGATTLDAMVFVDQVGIGLVATEQGDAAWTSAPHHLGARAQATLTDAPEYWALGNTPFDRASAYRSLWEERQSVERRQRLTSAVERGWPLGSTAFLRDLQARTTTPVAPKPRGRPRRPPGVPSRPLDRTE